MVVGHTYGPTDRSFGVIEHYTSRIETVYTSEQWYEHVTNAAAGIQVYDGTIFFQILLTSSKKEVRMWKTGLWISVSANGSTLEGVRRY